MGGAKSAKSGLYLIHSFDDKAAVKRGTSEGFCTTYTQNVLHATVPEKASSLSIYHFHESTMTISLEHSGFSRRQLLQLMARKSWCWKKTTASVLCGLNWWYPSPGSIWAYENMRFRHENPKLFQVHDEKCEHNENFQSTLSMIHDKVSHFIDSTSSLSFQAAANFTDFFKQHLILLWHCCHGVWPVAPGRVHYTHGFPAFLCWGGAPWCQKGDPAYKLSRGVCWPCCFQVMPFSFSVITDFSLLQNIVVLQQNAANSCGIIA